MTERTCLVLITAHRSVARRCRFAVVGIVIVVIVIVIRTIAATGAVAVVQCARVVVRVGVAIHIIYITAADVDVVVFVARVVRDAWCRATSSRIGVCRSHSNVELRKISVRTCCWISARRRRRRAASHC